MSDELLILNVGLYPDAESCKQRLERFAGSEDIETIVITKNDDVSEAEWDSILDKVMKFKRCITL
jgi:hypothetical protein